MPRVIDPNQSAGSYQFSQVNLKDARDKGVDKFTIVNLAIDASGSVHSFAAQIEACVKTIFEACQKSPFCHNLIVRLIKFNDRVTEVHGFKLLSDVSVSDYDSFLEPGGGTALFDATDNSIASVEEQAKLLVKDNDYDVNGCVYIVTDGLKNRGVLSETAIYNRLQTVIASELFKSFITVLIGVNTSCQAKDYDTGLTVSESLKNFKDKAGLTQYVEVENADAKSLARLAGFVSKSVSTSASGKISNNVGNGPNPNQTITI